MAQQHRTIISETIGNYSQTIKIGYKNEVEVVIDGKELFKGEATHINDNGQVLKFKDMDGKQYEFVKYVAYTYA
jgi:hypothetical protein